MGVLFDYFRAPDGETALRLLDQGDGVPHGPTTVGGGVDALDGKGIEPQVILGRLVGLILDVPWSLDLVETVEVWPPEETRPKSVEDWERLPEDSPWHTGPSLDELSDRIRDAFADADDHALPAIADQWTRIEEFGGHVDATSALRFVESLVALARRARRADDHLYCWMCL
ncbi:hypothetical protein [Actinoallomurus iriomotensis]|uniref:DUF1877 family protein n=1 Tax=Actinoallomurus iriomotensis TaxID=478107 RepID=A0A9W6RW67_9ACTN|nr:hypothetical protein [Actinoallomurus iriomotensis]GLY83786.1 hypothetical protein Airi02_017150 [Actinoallomurus iriomotensis]